MRGGVIIYIDKKRRIWYKKRCELVYFMSHFKLFSLLASLEFKLGLAVQQAMRRDFETGTSTAIELMNLHFAVIKQNGKIAFQMLQPTSTVILNGTTMPLLYLR